MLQFIARRADMLGTGATPPLHVPVINCATRVLATDATTRTNLATMIDVWTRLRDAPYL